MRKILLFVLLLLTTTFCFARAGKTKIPFKPEHELRLGVGAFAMVPDSPYFGNTDDYYWGYNSLSNIYNSELTYVGAQYMSGSISLGYSYNIKRWVAVGATFSYFGLYRNVYDRITDAKCADYNIHNLSLTPMVRFTYYNGRIVKLYSQLGIGVGLVLKDRGVGSYREYHLTGHLTPIGLSIGGRRVFGYAELFGIGNQGAFVLGVGYKFKNK